MVHGRSWVDGGGAWCEGLVLGNEPRIISRADGAPLDGDGQVSLWKLAHFFCVLRSDV